MHTPAKFEGRAKKKIIRFLIDLGSVLQIISPARSGFKNVFYVIIPPIFKITFPIMLAVRLLSSHIGFMVALRNLFTLHLHTF